MMAACLLIFSGMLCTSPGSHATWDREVMIASGPIIVAIDSDADLPSKEYGLLRASSENENDEEDGDRDDLKLLGVDLAPYFLTPAKHPRLAASALERTPRAVTSDAGASILRC
jgi:hypothetical protein